MSTISGRPALAQAGILKDGRACFDNPLTLLVIGLHNSHNPLRYIAHVLQERHKLNVTHQNVSYLLARIRDAQPDLLEAPLISRRAICLTLHCSRRAFDIALKKGVLRDKVVQTSDPDSVHFRSSDLKWVETQLLTHVGKDCPYCKERFLPGQKESGYVAFKTCTGYCARWLRHRQQREAYQRSLRPSPDILTGWRRTLWETVHSRERPVFAPEQMAEWALISQAAIVTQLTAMQLRYLLRHDALTRADHPTEVGKSGKPFTIIPRSEVDLMNALRAAGRQD